MQEAPEVEPVEKSFTQPSFKELFQLLSNLTTNKALVTVWIEACYTFGSAPTLLEIPDRILRTAQVVHLSYREHLTGLGKVLNRFSKNLGDLVRDWGAILKDEPNEVWLPSMNAFTNSEFWIGTDAAKVGYLSNPEDRCSKAVVSRVSEDGLEVGVIRVWPAK